MNKIKLLLLIISWGCITTIQAQICTALGQNPETAFPVCGTAVFTQNSVNICGNTIVVSRCNSAGINFTDKNPYWYKFTCFQSGTLGFTITPNNLGDDYDWQLFDVTNRPISEVYTNINLFVACNWSGDPGITGASAAGGSLINCEGPGVPLFSAMPNIIQGHNYLLLVSHFTDSQSGYSLTFGGGTGSITDPTDPHLSSASAACDGTSISVVLNKKMKCNTLAGNGSDFLLSPPVSTIISATGVSCNSGFDTDSLTLRLNSPLPAGNYTLTIRNGSDGNTLLDNCDRSIPTNEQIPLVVYPIQPTPMDSITKPGCAPNTIELVFRKAIKCSSIAPNGSDFIINGSYPVVVTGANGICSNGLTSKVIVRLATPLQTAGNFQITLQRGTDGNTLIDECGQECIAGQSLPFIIKDTVNANFSYTITLGCDSDLINYFHNGTNSVNMWEWTFGDAPNSNLQNPTVVYSLFGIKTTSLIVSNGTCSDTSRVTINLDNYIKAGFESSEFVCPGDAAIFRDTSIGNIQNWYWDFGNGITSNSQQPTPQYYLPPSYNYDLPVTLVITNSIGCTDTIIRNIKILKNCFIAVPSAFTPNNDGLNDYLYPLNAYKATDLRFSVYNRFGQRVFYTTDWTKKWNGTFNGNPAETGTYVWMLHYTDTETHKTIDKKGTSILIR